MALTANYFLKISEMEKIQKQKCKFQVSFAFPKGINC